MRETETDRERERERGWVSYERIHAVEFCILSLAACGLKQHPQPTATPATRQSIQEKQRERERERERECEKEIGERARAGGRSLFLLATFIGGLSQCGRKKEAFAAVENEARRTERVESS